MHANLRLGEVSRSVVEAAQWAEAVNRAGQLRMLSQRLARLAAQALAGSTRAAAEAATASLNGCSSTSSTWLRSASRRCRAGAGPRRGAWQASRSRVEPRATPAALVDDDAQAETLLEAAESLTAALELSGARRALHIVNLCGRQRMRAQRVAKDALLAALLPDGPCASAWRRR